MPRLSAIIAIAAAATATLPAPAAAPDALDCPGPGADRSLQRADVVFDGVALSGQNVDGRLVSPARMAVLRYRKGRGPRVLAVETGLRDDLTGLFTGTAGEFVPVPGQPWRVYGRLRGRRKRVRAGEVLPTSVCFGTRRLRIGSPLRRVPKSGTHARSAAGRSRWRAWALRGPRQLRCVAYRRLDRNRGRVRRACERTATRRSAVIDVLTDGAPRAGSTVVIAAGPGLRSVDVAGPDGAQTLHPSGRGRIALAVLAGYVAPADVRLALHFRSGADRVWQADAASRAQERDPLGGPHWTARAVPRPGRLCVGFAQDPPRFGPAPSFVGRAVCRRRGAELLYAVGVPLPLLGDEEPRTALYGLAANTVRSVVVSGPDGRRSLTLARRGRSFLAIFPGVVSHRDVGVEADFTDGSRVALTGRRSAELKR